MIKTAIAFIFVILCFVSCITYQKYDGHFGYSDEQVNDSIVRVTFSGSDDYDDVIQFLLYRCYEITRDENKQYFQIQKETSYYKSKTIHSRDPNGFTIINVIRKYVGSYEILMTNEPTSNKYEYSVKDFEDKKKFLVLFPENVVEK